MAEKEEQVKPLAPAVFQFRSDEDEAFSKQLKLRQRKYIKCCGCVTAIFLILAVIILVLSFTVFHVKNPVIRMNKITLQQLDLLLRNGTYQSDVNVTFLADVSVKNPNVASFKFNNGTTTIYYGGKMVGEARTPPGKAKAWRTFHMNVTVNIIPDKMLDVPSLMSDLSSRVLTMTSNTIIGGKVKILKIFKKYVVVEVNCSVTYNISLQAIQEENCRPHLNV